MTFITISTKKYKNQVIDLLELDITEHRKIGEEYFFSLPYHNFKDIIAYEQLENALEDIVIRNNDVIKNSQNALLFMKKTVFKPHRKNILYDIASTIECKGELNIDGYIDFKMLKYAVEIDRILYSAIKLNITKENITKED